MGGRRQVIVFDLGPTAAEPIKGIGVLGRSASFYVRGPVFA